MATAAPPRRKKAKVAPHLEAPSRYAAGSLVDHFAWWAERYCRHSIGQWAGEPLVFEPWQMNFLAEALAVDEEENPYWLTVVLVVPRKNGKTSMMSAYATYHASEAPGAPEVILAAASDKQAGRAFQAARRFVQAAPELKKKFHVREHVGQLARIEGEGVIERLASNPLAADGANPSLTLVDELHRFRTPKLVEFWGALTTAGGARDASQVFVITTETSAEDAEIGVLAPLIDGNERDGEVEEVGEGLTISRNHESRTLIYRYSAQRGIGEDEKDPRKMRRCKRAIRAANPASWISDKYLEKQAASSAIGDGEFLRLHANVRASGTSVWIEAPRWDGMRIPELPEMGPVAAGVDIGLSNDTSAITCAWYDEAAEKINLSTTVWAARTDVSAHHYAEGGRVRLSALEKFLLELRDRVPALNVVYDPTSFEGSAERLDDEGLTVVELSQNSAQMAVYYGAFYGGVKNDAYRHNGDQVFRSHVLSAIGRETPRGWKVEKLAPHRKIDALVAGVMAAGHLQLKGVEIVERETYLGGAW